jgi:hypothetical protein
MSGARASEHERFRARYGPWAVVAGASSGLGAELATQLAGRGLNLLLLARRGELLESLAAKLRAERSVEIRIAAIDLGAPELLARVRAASDDLEIGLLVYNAAFAPLGPFFAHSLEDKLRTVDVNCRGPLILADLFGRQMIARGRGGIVLMSSMAGSRGSPLVATYAATKAFNLVLAEGLWDELASFGVDVLACRPGATRTPNYEATEPVGRVPLMEPEPVVRCALDALGSKPSVVPGWINQVSDFFLGRLLSRRAAIRIMGRATRALYPQAALKAKPPTEE